MFDHIRNWYPNHIAAAGGTFFSLLNGASIINGVVVGLLLFVLTTLIRKSIKWFR